MQSPKITRRSSGLVDLFSLFGRSGSTVGRLGSIRLSRSRHRTRSFCESDASVEDDHEVREEVEDATKSMTREMLIANIRQKKDVIHKLRCQPWNMSRKRRTLRLAQLHLQQSEAKVSKKHLYKEELTKRWRSFSRFMDNMKIYLIPWEARIKQIESHFGSVVSSYFTFLRWVLGVNITMTMVILLFVTIPEMLADASADTARYNATFSRKVMPVDIVRTADELHTIWDFKGWFQYSLLFYGYYSSETYFGKSQMYRVPVAYFLVNLFVLGYSFFAILRRMAANARSSKLSGGKYEQFVFVGKVFAGWDFTIGNSETASNAVMANVNKLRVILGEGLHIFLFDHLQEAIVEHQVMMNRKFVWWRLAARILANLIFMTMLILSVWAIQEVSQITEKNTFFKQNAVSITVSFITLVFPNLFELVGRIEVYHPRTALRIQLARVLSLYIVNYYTIILSLFLMKELHKGSLAVAEQLQQHQQHQLGDIRMPRYVDDMFYRNDNQTEESLFNAITTESTTVDFPFTMMYTKFGPLMINNFKAMFDANSSLKIDKLVDSVYESRPLGPVTDWAPSIHSSSTPSSSSSMSNVTTGNEHGFAQRIVNDRFDHLCWETMIGQEITKLVTMDLVFTIMSVLVVDFLRALWVRFCNVWWCWNLETLFPQYGEFKVAENVLHLVNNQGMIWLGLFFVPLLPAINNFKLIIIMYIRGWAVMTCNVPAQQIFRASRSSNFYLMLLLLMLFLCTLPVGYVIVSERPSKICGPFGEKDRFYHVITDMLRQNLNKKVLEVLEYIASPGIVIPVLIFLLLVIYFLFSLVRGLREANSDLSTQLTHERTDEKKKIFELAAGRKKHHNHCVFDKSDYIINKLRRKKDSQPIEISEIEDSTPFVSVPSAFQPSLISVHEDDVVSEIDTDMEVEPETGHPMVYSSKTEQETEEELLTTENEQEDQVEQPLVPESRQSSVRESRLSLVPESRQSILPVFAKLAVSSVVEHLDSACNVPPSSLLDTSTWGSYHSAMLTPVNVVLSRSNYDERPRTSASLSSTNQRRSSGRDAVPLQRYPRRKPSDVISLSMSAKSKESDEHLRKLPRKPRFRISTSPPRRSICDANDISCDESVAKRHFIIRMTPTTDDDESRPLLTSIHRQCPNESAV